MQGHIDKLTKSIKFNINDKPIGATQWDFICSIPEASESLIKNYRIGPESLFIYLTNSCSMKCEKCNCKTSKENLKTKDIERIIKEEKNNRLKYIVLDGDPLLSDNIEEVIDIIIDSKLSYSINTFKCPTIDFLEKVKDTVAKIQFKMSGIDSLEYKKEVKKALDLCERYNIYTAIIFSLNKRNFNKIPEMIEFCKEHKVKQFSFSRLDFCPNTPMEKEKFINNKEYLEVSKKLVEIRDKESKIHVTSNDAIWKGCGACSLTATISADGNIYPCAFLKIKCGNIRDGVKVAWSSEIFENIRISNLKGKCGNCKYKLICKGCRAVAYETTKDYLGEDLGCWLTPKGCE